MYEFIAKFGYVISWAGGTPNCNDLDKFYNFGLTILIMMGTIFVIGMLSLIWLIIHRKD